jgi:plastocyanin
MAGVKAGRPIGRLLLAALAASPGLLVPATPGAGAEPAVTIVEFAFQPSTITITAGQTVVWTNRGEQNHTVTADDGSFDSGELEPNDAFGNLFEQPGTFTYHCALHPDTMRGTVVVEAAPPTPTPNPNATPPPSIPTGLTPPPSATPIPSPSPTPSGGPSSGPSVSAPTGTSEPNGGSGGPGQGPVVLVGLGAVIAGTVILLAVIVGRRR